MGGVNPRKPARSAIKWKDDSGESVEHIEQIGLLEFHVGKGST